MYVRNNIVYIRGLWKDIYVDKFRDIDTSMKEFNDSLLSENLSY